MKKRQTQRREKSWNSLGWALMEPQCLGSSACLLYAVEQGGGFLYTAEEKAALLHTDTQGRRVLMNS